MISNRDLETCVYRVGQDTFQEKQFVTGDLYSHASGIKAKLGPSLLLWLSLNPI